MKTTELLSEGFHAQTRMKIIDLKKTLAKALKLKPSDVHLHRSVMQERGLRYRLSVPVPEDEEQGFHRRMVERLLKRELAKSFSQSVVEADDVPDLSGRIYITFFVPDSDGLLP